MCKIFALLVKRLCLEKIRNAESLESFIVTCVLLDSLSLVEGKYYLKRVQYLLDFISVNELNAKEVEFADDFMVAGNLSSIKDYRSQLTSIGTKYSYFPKASKSYLRVKEDQLPNATALFHNSNVNVTVEGKRNLVAIVGSEGYKREYINELVIVKDRNTQLCMLPTVAESQPQAA